MAKKIVRSIESGVGCCKPMAWKWAVAEVAMYAFFYYVQYLLQVPVNLWVSSLVLLVLANIPMWLCHKKCGCGCC